MLYFARSACQRSARPALTRQSQIPLQCPRYGCRRCKRLALRFLLRGLLKHHHEGHQAAGDICLLPEFFRLRKISVCLQRVSADMPSSGVRPASMRHNDTGLLIQRAALVEVFLDGLFNFSAGATHEGLLRNRAQHGKIIRTDNDVEQVFVQLEGSSQSCLDRKLQLRKPENEVSNCMMECGLFPVLTLISDFAWRFG